MYTGHSKCLILEYASQGAKRSVTVNDGEAFRMEHMQQNDRDVEPDFGSTGHRDGLTSADYAEHTKLAIPAIVRMFSGCAQNFK